MKTPTPVRTEAISARNSISQSPLWRGFLFIAFALTCFALSPATRAVSPAPDGDYGNGNTAEGLSALFSLTTGNDNTALGDSALAENQDGADNTATGVHALYFN